MKELFKSRRFKVIAGVIALLLAGALICAANGRGETAQSGIIGTIFTPANWLATKISDGITYVFGEATGNAEYLERIDELENQVGSLQDQLADYENLQKQNQLYKDALELKEENPDYTFVEAKAISRDAADIFGSYTINKGTASGIKEGDAVLYGSYIVGIIDRAYPTYSVVKTILDPDFSVSAYEIVSGEISYVTGRAELAAGGRCILANLDSSTAVTYGSIIATAGISGRIPEGLIIGTVEEIEEDTASVASYAVIEPGVDVNNISECLVLTGYESEAQ
ncbi:MAG TPA: rod shape-determining protein MreC [Candidatus Eubacterium faecipullorum]|uniref:Cell shape-determining protein MreC n=1 Tax=Candidatus Eubacterium faecipullorum TaxID=2838571 RepID=A0A9D1RBS1_9FIRM|nr:rod shape-determining protein MreC [Candidatus Eubacterium faecipullorum]